MAINPAIILSTDNETTSICSESSGDIGMVLEIKSDFPSFILELQENDYTVILCDCSDNLQKCVQWVKIIKKMRPKIPLIIISNEIDKSSGGEIYQEGVFHLCEKPVNKEYLKEILSSTVIH